MTPTVVPLFLIDTEKHIPIMSIEERGTIFVNPGTEVYEGMIIWGKLPRERL